MHTMLHYYNSFNAEVSYQTSVATVVINLIQKTIKIDHNDLSGNFAVIYSFQTTKGKLQYLQKQDILKSIYPPDLWDKVVNIRHLAILT